MKYAVPTDLFLSSYQAG